MIVADRAAVIGLGLIGGSIARELASRGVHVRGFDAQPHELHAATRAGVVHEALDASLSGVAGAELIVIAVPVDAAVDVLARVAANAADATLITDVGSTKARIVDAATTLGVGHAFVGSHPIAGDHRSGSKPSGFGNHRASRCTIHWLHTSCEPGGMRTPRSSYGSVTSRPVAHAGG